MKNLVIAGIVILLGVGGYMYFSKDTASSNSSETTTTQNESNSDSAFVARDYSCTPEATLSVFIGATLEIVGVEFVRADGESLQETLPANEDGIGFSGFGAELDGVEEHVSFSYADDYYACSLVKN